MFSKLYNLQCPVGPQSATGCPAGCVDTYVACANTEGQLNGAVRIDNGAIWKRFILPTALLVGVSAFLLGRRYPRRGGGK